MLRVEPAVRGRDGSWGDSSSVGGGDVADEEEGISHKAPEEDPVAMNDAPREEGHEAPSYCGVVLPAVKRKVWGDKVVPLVTARRTPTDYWASLAPSVLSQRHSV